MKIELDPIQEISGAKLIKSQNFRDGRGKFSRLFCSENLGNEFKHLKQINYVTNNQKGLVRGMHYQRKPGKETKIVYCLGGTILDVIIDIREKSSTFGNQYSIELNAKEDLAILIPPGVAHGYQTLSDCAELLYLHSSSYDPKLDAGIHWNNNITSVNWPHKISLISQKDKSLPKELS